MDVLTQQKKLYADPHFGSRKRDLLAKFFDSVKTALTPGVDRLNLKEFYAADHESYTIMRNGVHHETFFANECACRVEIIALKKKYPHDDWTFKSDDPEHSENPAKVAA